MAKLTINQISIENFGPFLEQQKFDLSVRTGRPVILVKALNGSGKTTLLTALQIGLYGYKAINTSRRSEYEQLISGLQRRDAIGPARIEMHISIEVGSYQQLLTIRREWVIRDVGFREIFKVFCDGAEDLTLADEWDDFINGILPVELVHLFLFDGEKIEALANPERLPALLRRATEVFLGLGGIDTLANDLKALERRAGGKRTLAEEASDAQKQAEQFGKQLEDVNQRIAILTQRRAQARNDLDDAQRTLESFSIEAQREGLSSYQRAAELKANVDRCKEQHRQAQSSWVAALEDPVLPLRYLTSLWGRYKELWEQEQQGKRSALLADEFSKRDQRILETLAKNGFPSHTAIANLLAEDLKKISPEELRESILLPGGDPAGVEVCLQQAEVRLKQAKYTLDLAQSEADKATQSVEKIPAQEQLLGVFETMQRHTQSVSNASLLLQEISKSLDEAYVSQSHIDSRYKSAWQRVRSELKESSFQLKALEAADRAKQTLAVFRDKLLASKAQWLSDMITTEFKLLLRKRNFISRVVVEPKTYSVSIADSSGHMLPMERLSAGERQILAIAVLSALIRERKGRFPVVVDTPLARLDRSHREALVDNFFAKISHQVMVLSTDEEVEGTVYSALERHTNREYDVVFDDVKRSSCASIKLKQLSLEEVYD
jgi:DNA sulfur modification protein DndD